MSSVESIRAQLGNMSIDDQARDRREEFIQALEAFPSLKKAFAQLQAPVEADSEPVRLLRQAQTGGNGGALMKWLAITDSLVATFIAELNSRDNTIAAYVKTINSQKRENRDLKAQHLEAREIAQGRSHSDNNTLPNPTAFTGDEKNLAKRAEQFQNWRQRIRAVWLAREVTYSTEKSKFLHIAAVLDGSALRGISKHLDVIIANSDNPALWAWDTAEGLITELATKYDTFDLTADALKRMNQLRQAKEWADYNSFAAEYISLADTLNWDDTTRVLNFEKKLAEPLRQALRVRDTVPGPDQFDEWVALCRRISNRLATADQLTWDDQPSRHFHNYGRNAQNSNSGGNGNGNRPEPMDLDAMQLAIAKMPQEERDRRRQQGLCMNCGGAGHFARSCRKNHNPKPPRGGGFNGGFDNRSGYNNNNGGGFSGFGRSPNNSNSRGNNGFGGGFSENGNFGSNGSFVGGFGGGFGNGNAQGYYSYNNSNARGYNNGNAREGFGHSGYGNNTNARNTGSAGRGRAEPRLRFAEAPEYISPVGPGRVLGEVTDDASSGYSGYRGDFESAEYHQQGKA